MNNGLIFEDTVSILPQKLLNGEKLRGRLIIFEGLDGAGKTTQIELLGKYLQQKGYPIVITSWNSSRLISKAIKRAKKAKLLTPYLFSALHAADFIYRLEHIIIPSLLDGYIVLADRYVYTALARDCARNVNKQWVKNLYSLAPKPDLAFYCNTTIDKVLERIIQKNQGKYPNFYEAGMDVINHDDPHQAFVEFQTRVANEYQWITKEYGLIEINTAQSITDANNLITSIIDDNINNWILEEAESELDTKYYWDELPTPEDKAYKDVIPLYFNRLENHTYPGKLIVIQGANYKLTENQANLLYNELQVSGYDTRIILKDHSWIALEVARKALKKTVLSNQARVLLSIAELSLQYEQEIVPALKAGAVVVTNNDLATILADYLPLEFRASWFEPLFKVFNFKPDLTIFVDTTLDDLMKTKKSPTSPGILSQIPSSETLNKTINLYQLIASEQKWIKYNSQQTTKELYKQILQIVNEQILPLVIRGEPNPALKEILELLVRYQKTFDHSRKVAELAVSLFDQTTHLHGYGKKERTFLSFAALLHDIGHTISDRRHEEYTYDAIIKYPFNTISESNKEIIANIAFLHRQTYSAMKFEHLSRLGGFQQLMVKRLAALLRIADALDDSGRQVVHDVRCYEENGVVFIDLHAVSKALLERAAVLRKADMFEQIYQKSLVVTRNWIEKQARKIKKTQIQANIKLKS